MRQIGIVLVIAIALGVLVKLRSPKSAPTQATLPVEQTQPANEDVNTVAKSTIAQPQKLEAVAQPNFKEPKTDEGQVEELLYERSLQDLFTAIPKLKKENFSEEDLHHFSPMELQEAQALAEIQNLASKNKQYPTVTQRLYKDCTTDRDLAPTVRALCYFHALELSSQLKNSNEIVQLDLPIEIKKLALKLKPNGYL